MVSRQHVQHRSDHFIPHWAAARQRWRGYAWTEADGTRLRAKEAKKAYPRRLKKCRPHRARPFGAGLERQHGRRASPTADERLRSYEESRDESRRQSFPPLSVYTLKLDPSLPDTGIGLSGPLTHTSGRPRVLAGPAGPASTLGGLEPTTASVTLLTLLFR